jgi:hypothetical protein
MDSIVLNHNQPTIRYVVSTNPVRLQTRPRTDQNDTPPVNRKDMKTHSLTPDSVPTSPGTPNHHHLRFTFLTFILPRSLVMIGSR